MEYRHPFVPEIVSAPELVTLTALSCRLEVASCFGDRIEGNVLRVVRNVLVREYGGTNTYR